MHSLFHVPFSALAISTLLFFAVEMALPSIAAPVDLSHSAPLEIAYGVDTRGCCGSGPVQSAIYMQLRGGSQCSYKGALVEMVPYAPSGSKNFGCRKSLASACVQNSYC